MDSISLIANALFNSCKSLLGILRFYFSAFCEKFQSALHFSFLFLAKILPVFCVFPLFSCILPFLYFAKYTRLEAHLESCKNEGKLFSILTRVFLDLNLRRFSILSCGTQSEFALSTKRWQYHDANGTISKRADGKDKRFKSEWLSSIKIAEKNCFNLVEVARTESRSRRPP
jgi:hypothetical protein